MVTLKVTMDEVEHPPWGFDSWIHGWSTTASDERELLSYIRGRRRTLCSPGLAPVGERDGVEPRVPSYVVIYHRFLFPPPTSRPVPLPQADQLEKG